MGMIIIWGWELVFSLLSSLLTRLVRRLDMYICTTLRSNPVICIINIEELHLPILCYVGQYLTKERGINEVFSCFSYGRKKALVSFYIRVPPK